MRHSIVLLGILFAVWLLWSGLYYPLLIGLGALSSLLVVLVVHRMDVIDRESVPLHLGLGVFTYWGWLLKEIVRSNLTVLRLVLSPGLPISPRVVRIQAKPRGEVLRVVLGNSITLTPGTVTMDIDENGRITAHALTEDIARELEAGEMNRRVAALERGGGA